MKIFTHALFPRAAVLVASALLWRGASPVQAEEPLGTTAQRLDETAEQQGDANASARIGAGFTSFAGSEENATALVTGLHNGTTVALTTTVNGQVVTTEFQPATGKLGYGNAFISLALARDSLATAGITQPTPAQLIAALNGGSVTGSDGTAVSLAGVLTLRATGQGWGNIAQTLGVKLGPVVSGLHSANRRVERPDRPGFAGKPDSVPRGVESAGRPVGAGRPETVGRPSWAGNPGVGRAPITPPGQAVRPGRP